MEIENLLELRTSSKFSNQSELYASKVINFYYYLIFLTNLVSSHPPDSYRPGRHAMQADLIFFKLLAWREALSTHFCTRELTDTREWLVLLPHEHLVTEGCGITGDSN